METLFIGQNAIFLPEVESTNSYAIELLKNVNPIEGTLIYTTNQTQGRGQRGNSWMSEPGLNLAVSVILKPSFLRLDKLFYLYIISALAVHDLMAELLDSSQFDIKIKWPNDILVNSKKIAGILNENIISNGVAGTTVIGIGLNLNQSNFEDLTQATSYKILSGKEVEIKKVLAALCKHFEYYYFKLKNNHLDELLTSYYSHFYKLGEMQSFKIKDQIQLFHVKGINKSGLLHLIDDNGTDHYFDIKQATWI